MDFTNISLMVAIVMGLSEVFKNLGLNSKLIPVVNLILGVIVGLTSSGFYSGAKNTIENFK